MLKMRLQRIGRRNAPSFRVIVTESRQGPKSGKHVDSIGSYNPKTGEIQIDGEKATSWIQKGVQVSDTVHNMLVEKKIIEGKKINVLPKKSPIVSEETEAPQAAAAAETTEGSASTETEATEDTSASEGEEKTEADPAEESTEESEESAEEPAAEPAATDEATAETGNEAETATEEEAEDDTEAGEQTAAESTTAETEEEAK